ncbi:MAG: hypothetical protein ACW98U_03985 [Candidatus Thorarchaeota archaeon]|jgi:hypothetical protein
MSSANSLLVLLNSNEQDSELESIIGRANLLWSGKDGFEWIGTKYEDWDSVFLLKYDESSELQEAIDRFKSSNFKDIRLFVVNPVSAMRRRILRFLMKYVFSRFSVGLTNKDVNYDDLPQTAVLPSKEQHLRLEREDIGNPVVMVNFMEYHESPTYPDGFEGKRHRTGEEAYNKYETYGMRAVANLGGIIEHMGEVDSLQIGEQEEKWHHFALMRYPSHEAVKSMFRVRGTPEVGVQRDAGLKSTRVYAFTPS